MNLKILINWKKSKSENIFRLCSRNLFFKYLASTFLVFVTVSSLTAGSKGDINDDGNINILDITRSVNIILGKSPAPTDDESWASDFNSDGSTNILDVTNIINVILGKRIPPPLITSINPDKASIGSTIIIYGENFGDTQAGNIIKFDEISASVVSWTDSQIITTIPTGSGHVDLKVIINSIESNLINFIISLESISDIIYSSEGGTVELNDKGILYIPPEKFEENILVNIQETRLDSIKYYPLLNIKGTPLKLTLIPLNNSNNLNKKKVKIQKAPSDPVTITINYSPGDANFPYLDIGMNELEDIENDDEYVLYLWSNNDIQNHQLIADIPDWSLNNINNTTMIITDWESYFCNANAELIPDESDNSNLNGRSPIILIHGWQMLDETCEEFQNFDPNRKFENLVAYLVDEGILNNYKIYRFKYPTYLSPNINGNQLKQIIDQAFIGSSYADEIVLIGHSLGGLVGRSYIVSHQGHEKVSKLITLGTPHYGSPLAYPGGIFLPTEATFSLQPSSSFLNNLNQNDNYQHLYKLIAGDILFTPDLIVDPKIRITRDLMKLIAPLDIHHDGIVPVQSATMNNDENSLTYNHYDHFKIIDNSPDSFQEILRVLNALIPESPTTSGLLTNNETWGPDDSPIILTGDIVVPEGITLTILPGTEIRFEPTSDFDRPEPEDSRPDLISLNIFGTLTALGERDNEIIFTSNAPIPEMGAWHDIAIWGSGSGSVEYANISFGSIGIISDDQSTLTATNNNISYCRDGILCFSPASTVIRYNTLSYDSIGIGVRESSTAIVEYNLAEYNIWGILALDESDPQIRYNTSRNNETFGFTVEGQSTAYLSGNTMNGDTRGLGIFGTSHPTVENNTFTHTTYMGIQVYDSSTPIIRNNDFIDNVGSGIRTFHNSWPTIESNIFNGNSTSIILWNQSLPSIIGNTFVNDNENAIEFSSTHNGNASIYENNIHDNAWNMVNWSSYNKVAQNNWWGTTDESTISARLWDYSDNSTLGVIDFTPVASSPFPGDISGDDPPVNVEQLVTCENVNESSNLPINIKGSFTSNDPQITTYARYSLAKGNHTRMMRWYTPSGSLYFERGEDYYSEDFDTPYIWAYIYTSFLTSAHNGEWTVEVYWDGELKGTINFNYTDTAASSTVIAEKIIGAGMVSMKNESQDIFSQPKRSENENSAKPSLIGQDSRDSKH